MRNRILPLSLMMILLASLSAPASDVIERIVATVNGHIILQSDWDDEVSFESLMDARDPGRTTDQQRKAALDHLIDQELLRQQMQSSDFHHASDQELTTRIAEIRNQYPGVT